MRVLHDNSNRWYASMRRTICKIGFVVVCFQGLAGQLNAQAKNPLAELQQLRRQHQIELTKLVLESDNEKAESEISRFQLGFSEDRQTIFPFTSDPEKVTNEKLVSINQRYAKKLFDYVKSCDLAKHSSLAFQLLHEILIHDPDHKEARRILGFRKTSSGKWYRPSRKITARKATTKQSAVGWKARTYTIVDSGHYRISTTADSKTAIALARKLERWQNIWRQVYFDYWTKSGTIQRWIDGKASMKSGSSKRRVVLFKDRQEYLSTMQELGVQGAEHSTGNYNDKIKTIFFYAGDDDPDVRITWLHEQAHQLFQETGVTKKGATEKVNFWLVEAIAMYMESLTEPENKHHVTLSGIEAQRLQYARIRANRQGFLMPLKKLTAMGRDEFQRHQDVRSLYSQSAGLAHFLMNANRGEYRQAFVRMIRLAYEKRSKANSLADALGADYEKLDAAYRRFLVPNPKHLSDTSNRAKRTELALGAAPVTTEQLKVIADFDSIQWLQLSGTRIDDSAGKLVGGLKNLDQLFVDGTAVGDAFVAELGDLKKLTELDLANTQITDKSLDLIGRFSNLKALYLTKTKITDEGLAKLAALTQLEYLEVTGTKVTQAGLNRLKAKLPKLK